MGLVELLFGYEANSRVTDLGLLFLRVFMGLTLALAHAGDPFGDRELPLFFLVSALLLLLSRAGRYSVDAVVRGRVR
jgi:uncharacterized membrane protein YphA (DoxX/SURF4 family)